jgi:hypothetical protein
MKIDNSLRSISVFIKSFALLGVLLLFTQCNTKKSGDENKQVLVIDDKQKGAHFFGVLDSTNFQSLKQNNIKWLTLVAWSNQKDYDSPILSHHNGDSSQILKQESNWIRRIKLAHAAGFKVFIKPHVWINTPSDGKWRSDIFPTNDENWETWKTEYRNYILRYAKIAEQANAEMFCIGTEFSRLTVEKSLFWKQLIKDVRSIYSGKITYAANWYNEFENITFWDDLDFIGIQAYFPLVTKKYPSTEDIITGWNKHLPAIEAIHKKYNRKILFTEMGYRSTAESAIKPWQWLEDSSKLEESISMETQANCYEAFFNTVWNKEWFAGVHIWQLNNYVNSGGETNLDFTPQSKPAEHIITKGFK